jgi:hypothetical protein
MDEASSSRMIRKIPRKTAMSLSKENLGIIGDRLSPRFDPMNHKKNATVNFKSPSRSPNTSTA